MLENLLEKQIFSKFKKIYLSIHKNRYAKSFHDQNNIMLLILTSNKHSNVFWFFYDFNHPFYENFTKDEIRNELFKIVENKYKLKNINIVLK